MDNKILKLNETNYNDNIWVYNPTIPSGSMHIAQGKDLRIPFDYGHSHHLVNKLKEKLKDELTSGTNEDLYETILRKFGNK